MVNGLGCLLLCRAVLPEHDFLAKYQARSLFGWARQVFRPDLFAKLEDAGPERGMDTPQTLEGIKAITKIVLHTGRDIDQLTAEDIYEYRERFYRGLRSGDRSVNAAWELLQGIGVLSTDMSLRATLTTGQRTTEQLVDAYQIQFRPVRDLLVRYLNERRPSVDYTTLRALAQSLAGLFWADVERRHPDLHSLDLPADAVTAWKERLRHVTATDGTSKPRKNYLVVLGKVRTFYLDIQEWAMETRPGRNGPRPALSAAASCSACRKPASRPSPRCTNASASAYRTCPHWSSPPNSIERNSTSCWPRPRQSHRTDLRPRRRDISAHHP